MNYTLIRFWKASIDIQIALQIFPRLSSHYLDNLVSVLVPKSRLTVQLKDYQWGILIFLLILCQTLLNLID